MGSHWVVMVTGINVGELKCQIYVLKRRFVDFCWTPARVAVVARPSGFCFSPEKHVPRPRPHPPTHHPLAKVLAPTYFFEKGHV